MKNSGAYGVSLTNTNHNIIIVDIKLEKPFKNFKKKAMNSLAIYYISLLNKKERISQHFPSSPLKMLFDIEGETMI